MSKSGKKPHLHSVRFRNFKAFRDSGEINLRPITLIVGKNSAGKSSIIKGIAAAAQTVKERELPDSNFRLIGDNVNLGTFYDTIYNNDIGENFSIDFKLAQPISSVKKSSDRWNFSFSYQRNEDNPLAAVISGVEVEYQKSINDKYSIVRSGGLYKNRRRESSPRGTHMQLSRVKSTNLTDIDILPPMEGKEKPMPHMKELYEIIKKLNQEKGETDYIDKWKLFIRDFALEANNDFYDADFEKKETAPLRRTRSNIAGWSSNLNRMLADSSYLGPIRLEPAREARLSQGSNQRIGPKGENLEKILHYRYTRDEKFRQNLDSHLKNLGIADSIKTSPSFTKVDGKEQDTGYIKILLKKSGNYRSMLDLGFGTSQVLPVVLEITSREETLILLEQPELHLHPAAQSAMGSVLKSSIDQGNQLIVETHSANLIERLRRLIRENVLNKNDVNIIYVGSNDNNETFCQSIGFDENGKFTEEWPEDTFFGEREKEYLGW